MIDSGGSGGGPSKELVNLLVPESSVRESKIETEAVALARLENDKVKGINDHEKFKMIVSLAGAVFAVCAFFLIYAYNQSGVDEDLQGRIVLGFISGLSGAAGVLLGKRF
jgi:hypothetical protein